MDVTVIVSTFGEQSWVDLAEERAVPSALAQSAHVIHTHRDSLQDARNDGLAQVLTEWVIHLDADDELEPGYVAAMLRGSTDVRVPAVRYVRNGRDRGKGFPRVSGHDHDCGASCLPYGNWIVVGAMARADDLRGVGGWRDFTWSEDWDLWLRCFHAGRTFSRIPAAVYRAHVRADSRNRKPARATKLEAHRAIARANGVPVP